MKKSQVSEINKLEAKQIVDDWYPDVRGEGPLHDCLDDLEDAIATALAAKDAKIEEWRRAEHSLSDAYLRLRNKIPGAFNTPHAPSSQEVWTHTEKSLNDAMKVLSSF